MSGFDMDQTPTWDEQAAQVRFQEAAAGLRLWLEHQSRDLPRGGWLYYTSRVYLGEDGTFTVENESLLPADARPVSDPSETLALIAEYKLDLHHYQDGSGAVVASAKTEQSIITASGRTIGDAVRACVQRIREGNRV